MIVKEVQFCFMLEKGTIDAVFILRRQQEVYRAKGNFLFLCLMDLERLLKRYQDVCCNMRQGRN